MLFFLFYLYHVLFLFWKIRCHSKITPTNASNENNKLCLFTTEAGTIWNMAFYRITCRHPNLVRWMDVNKTKWHNGLAFSNERKFYKLKGWCNGQIYMSSECDYLFMYGESIKFDLHNTSLYYI